MRKPFRAGLAALALAVAAGTAFAQTMPGMNHGQMMGHDMGHMGPASSDSPSSRAFEEANRRMHQGMDIAFSGDADLDFARGMLPHHQGAVEMAKVELEHGKDPELRKLAQDIVKAQESEIAFLKSWLEKHGK